MAQFTSRTHLIAALIITTLCIIHSVNMAPMPIKNYELIVRDKDSTTGSVTLTCRDAKTADELAVDSVNFAVNSGADIREKKDFSNIETVGCCSIKFNLLRNQEGNYTCGNRINDTLQESLPLTLISPQTVVTLPDDVQTTFTATEGGTAVLHCPIQPGALLQYYSVRWIKSNTPIAKFSTPKGFHSTDSHYSIDRSSFSLTINPVNVNDSDTSYNCEVYVRNPIGNNNEQLIPSRQISLTLNVVAPAEPIVIYSTVEVAIDNVCKCYWNGGSKEAEKSGNTE